jgi:predicted nucleotidyltransferase
VSKTRLGPLPDISEFERLLDDITTTQFHQAAIEKGVKIAEGIEEVEGVILKGSLAVNKGDVFSDIDFQVIHEDDQSVSLNILERFVEALEKIEPIIQHFPSTANPNDSIIYLHPFIKFELSVATCDEIKKRWRAGLGKVLFDRNGLATEVVTEAKKHKFNIDEHIHVIASRAAAIPVFMYITAGHLVRGERITALQDIDWIRNDMLCVSGWLLGLHDEGSRRAEERFPNEVLDYYNRSRVGTVDEIWEGLQILLDWYEQWLVPKFDKLHIAHSQNQVAQMRDILRLISSK